MGWSRQVLLGLSVAPLGILSAVAFRINESPRWLLITGRRALAAQALNHLRQVGPRVLHGGRAFMGSAASHGFAVPLDRFTAVERER